MTLVRCPGCSESKHDYNDEDPFSVGYVAGFHHIAAHGYVGQTQEEVDTYLNGIQMGNRDSKGWLVQQVFFK